jgi:cysteine-rich repeat protein
VLDPGEQCDDGNTTPDDGCSGTCAVEPGWTCNGQPSVCATTCGDGVQAGTEECDDGNLIDGDGCSSSCQLEAGCGNGVLDPGEQCDDGNTVDGDGCSATCLSELIPGIATPKRECVHEWLALPVPPRDRNGLPIRRVSCTDNDPTCDFGAVSGECTFHLAQCLNVTERRFACSPTDVARVQILSPRENRPRNPIDEANRDALEASLAGVGGVVRGQCARPLSKRGQLCTVNADCDSAAGRGNGRCRGRFVAFAPALSAADSCTSFADIRVPLGRTEKLLLSAAPSAGGSDLNVLHLRCKP